MSPNETVTVIRSQNTYFVTGNVVQRERKALQEFEAGHHI